HVAVVIDRDPAGGRERAVDLAMGNLADEERNTGVFGLLAEPVVERTEPQEQLPVRRLPRKRVPDRRREQTVPIEEPAPVVVGIAAVAGPDAGLRRELPDLVRADVAELRARDLEVAPPGDPRVVAVAVHAGRRKDGVLAGDDVVPVRRDAD